MGCIHEGHLSLIDIANKNADVTVVSIFVNQMQFNPDEDYRNYPRNLERDKRLLKKRGCCILFYPDAGSMYNKFHKTEVYVRDISRLLCGVKRKTHFKGVTTVVAKLFNIIKPDSAVFGQKDAQQAIIIRRMVEDLNFDIKILVGPIVREDDGLAMSSRNVYLTKKERKEAVILYQSIQGARNMIDNGERSVPRILRTMRKMIQSKETARLNYVKAVETKFLKPVTIIKTETLIAIACHFGKARLIDNTIVRV